MAVNTGKKRVATKHIRDGIKSNYKKKCNCEICGTDQELELHHYITVSLLLKKYAHENSISIDTDEDVLAMREQFYQRHWHELVEYTVTLCAFHHKLLHKIYGREPVLTSAVKQERWVVKQAEKFKGGEEAPKKPKRRFSDLI